MKTASQIIDMMKHAIGGTPDSRHDLWATLNQAGRSLTEWRAWSWRVRGPVPIVYTPDEETFDLPADFAGMLACEPDAITTTQVRIVSISEFLRLRSLNIQSGTVTYMCFPHWSAPGDSGSEVRPLGRVFPAPSEAESGLSLVYQARWTELRSTDTTAIPSIPREFERALELMARDYAICYQNQKPSIESEQAMQEITRLIHADERRQPQIGMLRGGAGRFVGRRGGAMNLGDLGVTPGSLS